MTLQKMLIAATVAAAMLMGSAPGFGHTRLVEPAGVRSNEVTKLVKKHKLKKHGGKKHVAARHLNKSSR